MLFLCNNTSETANVSFIKKTVEEVSREQDSQCKVDDVLKWDVTKMQLRAAQIKYTAEEEKKKKQKFNAV